MKMNTITSTATTSTTTTTVTTSVHLILSTLFISIIVFFSADLYASVFGSTTNNMSMYNIGDEILNSTNCNMQCETTLSVIFCFFFVFVFHFDGEAHKTHCDALWSSFSLHIIVSYFIIFITVVLISMIVNFTIKQLSSWKIKRSKYR